MPLGGGDLGWWWQVSVGDNFLQIRWWTKGALTDRCSILFFSVEAVVGGPVESGE